MCDAISSKLANVAWVYDTQGHGNAEIDIIWEIDRTAGLEIVYIFQKNLFIDFGKPFDLAAPFFEPSSALFK